MIETKDVRITNPSVNVNAKVKMETGPFDDSIRVKSVWGGRQWIILGCAIAILFELSNINAKIGESNTLKEEEIKVKKEQVQLARRQYVLDSLRYYHPTHQH